MKSLHTPDVDALFKAILTLQSVEGECSIFTLTLPVERIKDEYGEQ